MSDSVDYEFIDDQDSLLDVCDLIDSLEEDEYIGLDTEFMRITCYYPDFSLMQLSIRGQNYLIDVWMLEGNVQPIIESLCHTKAVVLAFSCSEDIELLAHEARRINCDVILPKRIYDIQLLMSFAGHSYGRGLNFALQQFLGITLAKDCTRSDWNRRPLTSGQLIYSALDVEYLEKLFHAVCKITPKENFEYFKAEMDYIRQSTIDEPTEDEAYLSIPGAGMLNDNELNVLYHLAKERQLTAQMDNEALNRVITTKSMWQLARYLPRSKIELENRGVKYGTIRQYGDNILKWLNFARKAPRYEHLTIPYDYYSHRKSMQENLDCLKKAVADAVERNGLCPQVLIKKQLLNDYFRAKALGYTPLLQQSWRLEILGKIDIPLEPMSKIDDDHGYGDMPSPRYVTDYIKLNDVKSQDHAEMNSPQS